MIQMQKCMSWLRDGKPVVEFREWIYLEREIKEERGIHKEKDIKRLITSKKLAIYISFLSATCLSSLSATYYPLYLFIIYLSIYIYISIIYLSHLPIIY